MTISEPATLITDYILGVLSGVFAVLLMRRNRRARHRAVTCWALALVAAAMGSFVGGTYHGFHSALGAPRASALWTLTTISMGLASFLLLAAGFTAAFSGRLRTVLLGLAFVKLCAYTFWMLGHDEFRYVIYDYGSTLAILLMLVATGQTNGAAGHRALIASGIGLSIAAAVVQQSGIRLHQHFNHNDLMHVVQMGGVWFLYRGGALLRDRER